MNLLIATHRLVRLLKSQVWLKKRNRSMRSCVRLPWRDYPLVRNHPKRTFQLREVEYTGYTYDLTQDQSTTAHNIDNYKFNYFAHYLQLYSSFKCMYKCSFLFKFVSRRLYCILRSRPKPASAEFRQIIFSMCSV